MHIVPSIFIQTGRVVSLYKGNENPQKKSYPKMPHNYAALFQKQGASALFIVDLDGDQLNFLPKIRAEFHGEIWWAGKVRSLEKIQACLDAGVDRVVLGYSARDIYSEAIAQFGADKLIAGLQVQHYDEAPNICEFFGGSGFKRIIVKDLNAEGTLFQPNFDLMEKCAYFSGLEIYASGGVSDEDHLHLLARAGAKGVVIGRAFYEHQLSLEALVQRFEDAQP